jgi:hypothetical protein
MLGIHPTTRVVIDPAFLATSCSANAITPASPAWDVTTARMSFELMDSLLGLRAKLAG